MRAAFAVLCGCTLALVYEFVLWRTGSTVDWFYAGNYVAGWIAAVASYWRARQGHPRQAFAALTVLLVLITLNSTIVLGLGVRAPIMILLCALILGVNFIMGQNHGRALLAVTSACLGVIYLLELSGWVPGMAPDRVPPSINTVAVLFCLYACAYVFSSAYQQRSDEALAALAAKNNELLDALAAKDLALEEKARAQAAKDRFLATMSHELRTPMAGIRTAIALLQNPRVSPESRTRYLNALDTSTEGLLRLLNDLLDTSQMEAGALKVHTRPVRLHDLAMETLALFELSARQKGLLLHHDLQMDADLTVMADPARLRQMLSNLLGNAVKFTDTGSIGLEILRLDTAAQPDRWTFRISDTGPGITTAEQERLFQPFSQLEHAGHDRGGSGLGLSIVRKLAEAMGGAAGVQSTPGQGSTFWFSVQLPLVTTADASAESSHPTAA